MGGVCLESTIYLLYSKRRCAALNHYGIEAHTLYLMPGTGLQNNTGTVFTMSDNEEIRTLLEEQQYDAVISTSDINMLERLRVFLHYKGKIIFEAQGLGTREAAVETIEMASPYL